MEVKLLKGSVNYSAEFDKLRKRDNLVDHNPGDRYLIGTEAVLSAASAHFEVVGPRNVTSCHNGSSFIRYETSIQNDASVRVKIEGEDSVCDVDEFSDNKCTAHYYLSREEHSEIMFGSDHASNTSFGPPCDKNVLKYDLGGIESNLSCSPGGYESSTLVTDIDIKEEEISWDVKMESDDRTISMEDEQTLDDVNDGDREVQSSGQHDTKIKIEDAVLQCESAVTRIGNRDDRFICQTCDFQSSEESDFQVHICSDILESPFELSHCSSSSTRFIATKNHDIKNLKEKPSIYSHTTTLQNKSASKNSDQKEGENRFQCSECTYTSSSKRNLKIHVRTHTSKKPLNCLLCTYTCIRKGDMTMHMRTHRDYKPFKCLQCNYASQQRSHLEVHMRVHTGDKPYKCTQCPYACTCHGRLMIHMRKHTSEKPFKCAHCSYACSQKCHLIRHMGTHTGNKPFKCSRCTNAFSSQNHLTRHMLTHAREKPYKCSQCNYTFSRKESLKMHLRNKRGCKMLRHAREKCFKCSHCNYAFTRKENLKTHLRNKKACNSRPQ